MFNIITFLGENRYFVENNIFTKIHNPDEEMKMRLISTLGWTARVIIEAAKILEPDENIVIYGYVDSEEKKVKKALEEVKNTLNNVTEVKVDPMNFHNCIVTVEKYFTEDSVANITGGTKIMAFSLALKAAILDLPIIYVVTENGETKIKRLPIALSDGKRNFFRMRNENSTTYRILKILVDEYNGKAKMKELRERLNKRHSTMSDAKNRLIRANLIQEEKRGREKYLIANSGAYLFRNSSPPGGNAL